MPDVEIDRRTTEMNYQQIFREVCVTTIRTKVATRTPWPWGTIMLGSYLQMPIIWDNELRYLFCALQLHESVQSCWKMAYNIADGTALYWQDVLMSHCQELVFCSDLGIYLQVVFN